MVLQGPHTAFPALERLNGVATKQLQQGGGALPRSLRELVLAGGPPGLWPSNADKLKSPIKLLEILAGLPLLRDLVRKKHI